MDWQVVINFLQTVLMISFVCGILAFIFFLWTYRDIRKLHIPANAGFFGTLRVVPLRVVIFLDLLDAALDTFAAPVAWMILRWLKLDHLMAPTIIEDLIPGTQFIPTMTLCWVGTRLLNLGELPAPVADVITRAPATTVIEGRVVSR